MNFAAVKGFARSVVLGAAPAMLLGAGLLSACTSGGVQKKGSGESILELFTPMTPAEASRWAVDPHDPDKRARGMLMLANAPWGGEAPYLALYEEGLTDGDPGVRAVAARALGMHGAPEHVPLILENIASEDRLLRWETVRALQRLHNPVAVKPLIERLAPDNESDPDVRASAANALGQYAEPQVVDALIAALEDRNLAVCRAAEQSLHTLTGQQFGQDIGAWVEWRKASGASASGLFASRGEYLYPVYRRDKKLIEYIWPWAEVPNEVQAAPVGMPVRAESGQSQPPTQP